MIIIMIIIKIRIILMTIIMMIIIKIIITKVLMTMMIVMIITTIMARGLCASILYLLPKSSDGRLLLYPTLHNHPCFLAVFSQRRE